MCRGLHELKLWCTTGYNSIKEADKAYSDWLAIPQSIKTTSIKPSGTVSVLAGGVFYLHACKHVIVVDCPPLSNSWNALPYITVLHQKSEGPNQLRYKSVAHHIVMESDGV